MLTLAQGWLKASMVAQAIADTLLRPFVSTKAYQDDLSGVGDSFKKAKDTLLKVLAYLKKFGAHVKPGSIVIAQDTLGHTV